MTDIICTINYACDTSEPGAKPFTFAKLLGSDTHLSVKARSTSIRDVRPLFEKGEGPKLAAEGFEAVKHEYEGGVLDGENGWEETYAQDMAEVSFNARSSSAPGADQSLTVAASSSRCHPSSAVWRVCPEEDFGRW